LSFSIHDITLKMVNSMSAKTMEELQQMVRLKAEGHSHVLDTGHGTE
jgi:hypothetical protein